MPNPIAHWNMEGTFVDSAGAHHGAPSGFTSALDGGRGTVMTFASVNSSAPCAASTAMADALTRRVWTVSFWLGPTAYSPAGEGLVLGSLMCSAGVETAGFSVRAYAGGVVNVTLPGASGWVATPAAALPLATYTHFAVVASSTYLTIYKNGALLVSSVNVTLSSSFGSGRITFGRPGNCSAGSYVGAISNTKFYSASLSANEVTIDYTRSSISNINLCAQGIWRGTAAYATVDSVPGRTPINPGFGYSNGQMNTHSCQDFSAKAGFSYTITTWCSNYGGAGPTLSGVHPGVWTRIYITCWQNQSPGFDVLVGDTLNGNTQYETAGGNGYFGFYGNANWKCCGSDNLAVNYYAICYTKPWIDTSYAFRMNCDDGCAIIFNGGYVHAYNPYGGCGSIGTGWSGNIGVPPGQKFDLQLYWGTCGGGNGFEAYILSNGFYQGRVNEDGNAPTCYMGAFFCGNGRTSLGEVCDDANYVAGDGCGGCQLEPGWSCSGDEPSVCFNFLALAPAQTYMGSEVVLRGRWDWTGGSLADCTGIAAVGSINNPGTVTSVFDPDLGRTVFDLTGSGGTRQGLVIPYSSKWTFHGSHTISVWFKFSTLPACASGISMVFLTRAHDFGRYVNGGTSAYLCDANIYNQALQLGGSWDQSSIPIPSAVVKTARSNVWHHLVSRYGPPPGGGLSSLSLWLDGVKITGAMPTQAEPRLRPSTGSLIFGGLGDSRYGAAWALTGRIGPAKLWAGALSDQGVLAHYAGDHELCTFEGLFDAESARLMSNVTHTCYVVQRLDAGATYSDAASACALYGAGSGLLEITSAAEEAEVVKLLALLPGPPAGSRLSYDLWTGHRCASGCAGTPSALPVTVAAPREGGAYAAFGGSAARAAWANGTAFDYFRLFATRGPPIPVSATTAASVVASSSAALKPASYAVDGELKGSSSQFWEALSAAPQTLEVTFATAQLVTELHVYMVQDTSPAIPSVATASTACTLYPITALGFSALNPVTGAYEAVGTNTTGNTLCLVVTVLPIPVLTTAVRLTALASLGGPPRVVEFRAIVHPVTLPPRLVAAPGPALAQGAFVGMICERSQGVITSSTLTVMDSSLGGSVMVSSPASPASHPHHIVGYTGPMMFTFLVTLGSANIPVGPTDAFVFELQTSFLAAFVPTPGTALINHPGDPLVGPTLVNGTATVDATTVGVLRLRLTGIPDVIRGLGGTFNFTFGGVASFAGRDGPSVVVDPSYRVWVERRGARTFAPLSSSLAPVTLRSPKVLSITAPGFNPQIGGSSALVTFTGTDFGLTAADLTQASLGPFPCQPLTWVNTSVAICGVTPGVGVQVAAVRAFGTSYPGTAQFSYFSPLITAMLPPPVLRTILSRVGGANITLLGSNFGHLGPINAAMPTVVSLRTGTGALVPCTNTTLLSFTAVVCTVPPGTGALMPLSVNANGLTGETVAPMTASYAQPQPIVASVSPASLDALDPTGVVTVFLSPAGGAPADAADIISVTLAARTCTFLAFLNATAFTCAPVLTPGAATGPVGVTTYLGGPFAAAGGPNFTFLAPSVTGIAPRASYLDGGLTITLFGSGFTRSPAVNCTLASVPAFAPSIVTVSATTVTCVSASSPVPARGPAVLATLLGGPSASAGVPAFTYIARPVVSAVQPVGGFNDGDFTVTLFGSGFMAGVGGVGLLSEPVLSGVYFGGANCSESMAYISSSMMTCSMGPNPAAPGPVSVTVTVTMGLPPVTSSSDLFLFGPPQRLPVVKLIEPATGSAAGRELVTLTGRNFGSGPSDLLAIFFGDSVSCASIIWVSSTSVICVTGEAPVYGLVAATVVTSDGGQGNPGGAYVFLPLLKAAYPRDLRAAGGDRVTVTGRAFTSTAGLLASNITISIGPFRCPKTIVMNDRTIVCDSSPTRLQATFDSPPVFVAVGSFTVELPPARALLTYRDNSFIFCDPPCGIAFCVSGACRCDKGSAPPPDCSQATVNSSVTASSNSLTEGGGAAQGAVVTSTLHPSTSPSGPVTVAAVCTDTLLRPPRRLSSQTVVLAPGVPVPLSVVAAADGKRAPVVPVTCVTRTACLADGLFDGLISDPFTLLLADQPPLISAFSPKAASIAGGTLVTVYGSNFDPTVNVTFNGVPGLVEKVMFASNQSWVSLLQVDSSNSTSASNTSVRAVFSSLQLSANGTDNSTGNGTDGSGNNATAAVFRPLLAVTPLPEVSGIAVRVPLIASLVPASTGVTFVSTAVTNLYSGGTTTSDSLYLSELCPRPGDLGTGANCRPCPQGAECPGGNRILPLPGYWTPSETSGFVVACSPPEACLGGAANACAERYSGRECSTCVSGYYKSGAICAPCPQRKSRVGSMTADVVLWTTFALVATFVRNRRLLSLQFLAIRVLQGLVAVGSATAGNTPQWILSVYHVLHMFSGDYALLVPECGLALSFNKLFFTNVAYVLMLMFPTFAMVTVMTAVSKSSGVVFDSHLQTKTAAGVLVRDRTFFKDRMVRCSQMALGFWYLPLTTLALSTIACKRDPASSKWFMMARPSEPCFRGDRVSATVASVVILVVLTVGYPVLTFFHMHRKRQLVFTSERFQARWDSYYGLLKPAHRFMFLGDYPILVAIALSRTAVKPFPLAALILTVAIFALKIGYILARRPFVRPRAAVIQLLSGAVSIVMANSTFFATRSIRSFHVAATAIFISVTVGTVVILGMILLLAVASNSRKEDEVYAKAAALATEVTHPGEGGREMGKIGKIGGGGDDDSSDDSSSYEYVTVEEEAASALRIGFRRFSSIFEPTSARESGTSGSGDSSSDNTSSGSSSNAARHTRMKVVRRRKASHVKRKQEEEGFFSGVLSSFRAVMGFGSGATHTTTSLDPTVSTEAAVAIHPSVTEAKMRTEIAVIAERARALNDPAALHEVIEQINAIVAAPEAEVLVLTQQAQPHQHQPPPPPPPAPEDILSPRRPSMEDLSQAAPQPPSALSRPLRGDSISSADSTTD